MRKADGEKLFVLLVNSLLAKYKPNSRGVSRAAVASSKAACDLEAEAWCALLMLSLSKA